MFPGHFQVLDVVRTDLAQGRVVEPRLVTRESGPFCGRPRVVDGRHRLRTGTEQARAPQARNDRDTPMHPSRRQEIPRVQAAHTSPQDRGSPRHGEIPRADDSAPAFERPEESGKRDGEEQAPQNGDVRGEEEFQPDQHQDEDQQACSSTHRRFSTSRRAEGLGSLNFRRGGCRAPRDSASRCA